MEQQVMFHVPCLTNGGRGGHMRRYMLTFSGTTALLFALLGSTATPTLAQTQDGPLNMTSDISNRQDIRQDVRGDFRFLNTDLKDARQDVAKLNADLAAKADAATIAADMNKLNADLKDASFHRRDLRGDFRELQSNLKETRSNSDIRQDIRGDFRFLNTDLKDARQDVAKLNADLAAKADAATIAADMNKLNADLKDASFHRQDLRGDFRELQSDLKETRSNSDIRQEIRGDFRFLNTDLKDARQDVAKLNADLAAKADAATIAADMNKLNADLKDASFHQRDLRGDFR